jgi:outer membrane protein assembly factor BamD
MTRRSVLASVLAATVCLAGCATPEDPVIKPLVGLSDLQYDAGVIMNKAENLYAEKKCEEAEPEYERFLELHPVHRWAVHAQFKLALCYSQRIPAVGRDPSIAEKAAAAFERVLSYSDTRYHDAAQAKLNDVRRHLAQSDFEVGRFYYKQGQYPAAIARFQKVLDAKVDGAVAEEAAYFLALAYERDGQLDKATEAAQALIDAFPKTRHAKDISKLKARLASRAG